MSYPQFNLTTLQLPAPASNMTKAEYKVTYGIDLDEVNIKAFKLVLLGNEKYPINQIKEIEGGYEIYFNGRILSITDTIQTSDEVYDVANAKPIYIHPVFLSDGATNYNIQVLIFDNRAEPYTLSTIKSKIIELIENGAIIQASGWSKNNDVYCSNYNIRNIGGTRLLFVFDSQSGYQQLSLDAVFNAITSCVDGVNKIN